MRAFLITSAWFVAGLCPMPSLAQAAPSAAQVERNAVDLKQGMTIEEVQKLLGKPQRTTLRSNGSVSSTMGQGGLQWTYVWNNGGGMSSSSERTLSVDFAAKAADQWLVNGWSWNNNSY